MSVGTRTAPVNGVAGIQQTRPDAEAQECLTAAFRPQGTRNMASTFRQSGRSVRPLPKECQRFLLLACAATLFFTACSRPADSSRNITVEHEVSPVPARTGPAVITVRLADPAAGVITGARATLEADMSDPGMAPVFAEAREIKPGRYQAHLRF